MTFSSFGFSVSAFSFSFQLSVSSVSTCPIWGLSGISKENLSDHQPTAKSSYSMMSRMEALRTQMDALKWELQRLQVVSGKTTLMVLGEKQSLRTDIAQLREQQQQVQEVHQQKDAESEELADRCCRLQRELSEAHTAAEYERDAGGWSRGREGHSKTQLFKLCKQQGAIATACSNPGAATNCEIYVPYNISGGELCLSYVYR